VNKAYEKFEKQLKAAKGSGGKQKADKVSETMRSMTPGGALLAMVQVFWQHGC
jgi:hypothetical protein